MMKKNEVGILIRFTDSFLMQFCINWSQKRIFYLVNEIDAKKNEKTLAYKRRYGSGL